MNNKPLNRYAVTVRFTAPYCCAATTKVQVIASSIENARIFARLEIPSGSYNVRILDVVETVAYCFAKV